MKKLVALIAAAVVLPACTSTAPSLSQGNGATHTQLKDCVIQEVIPGKDMTGAFAKFVHEGPAVQITRAEVPGVSNRVELHSMEMKNGVMEMIPLTNPSLDAGERVFKKGADHVMLFDIANKPAVGSHHEMKVYFSDGTHASCTAVVKSVKEVMRDAGMTMQGGHDAKGAHGGHKPADAHTMPSGH
ncbi:MAG: copper chaperone PCu(A)C [Lautropia sp.]|nr:copper chaperone PCu(A)C [Lautropia sp.]